MKRIRSQADSKPIPNKTKNATKDPVGINKKPGRPSKNSGYAEDQPKSPHKKK